MPLSQHHMTEFNTCRPSETKRRKRCNKMETDRGATLPTPTTQQDVPHPWPYLRELLLRNYTLLLWVHSEPVLSYFNLSKEVESVFFTWVSLLLLEKKKNLCTFLLKNDICIGWFDTKCQRQCLMQHQEVETLRKDVIDTCCSLEWVQTARLNRNCEN